MTPPHLRLTPASAKSDSEVPLTTAAAALKVNYQRLRNAAIRGEIQGRQVAGRFWVVDLASATRWVEELRRAEGPPSTAESMRSESPPVKSVPPQEPR